MASAECHHGGDEVQGGWGAGDEPGGDGEEDGGVHNVGAQHGVKRGSAVERASAEQGEQQDDGAECDEPSGGRAERLRDDPGEGDVAGLVTERGTGLGRPIGGRPGAAWWLEQAYQRGLGTQSAALMRGSSNRSVVRAYQPAPCMRPTRPSFGVSM